MIEDRIIDDRMMDDSMIEDRVFELMNCLKSSSLAKTALEMM